MRQGLTSHGSAYSVLTQFTIIECSNYSNLVFRNFAFAYSVYRRDINIFKPNFQKYITDLAKVNGCPFIDKNSKTNSQ